MRIDSGVRNSVVAGHSRDPNYMSPARSLVSSKGSNAGQSPQFDIESVHSRQGVSPHHGEPSNDQQAIDLNDELSELAQKSRTVLDSMIAEKNRVLEEKQALENRLASMEEKMAKLIEKKNNLAVEKARLAVGTAEKEGIITKLQKENTKVERDNSTLVERNAQLVEANAKLVEDKANLTVEISDHNNTTRQLLENMSKLRTELRASGNENEQLKEESMQKDSEIGRLKSENQVKEGKLQEAQALLDRYVKKSEEQAEMLNTCIKKKDGLIAKMKREKAELASQLEKEIELRDVENAVTEEKKNAVMEAILPDRERKLWSEFKTTIDREQKQEQKPEENVAAEMPGTSFTFLMIAGQKRKAPEEGQDGPLASSSKMVRNTPKKQGKGAKN